MSRCCLGFTGIVADCWLHLPQELLQNLDPDLKLATRFWGESCGWGVQSKSTDMHLESRLCLWETLSRMTRWVEWSWTDLLILVGSSIVDISLHLQKKYTEWAEGRYTPENFFIGSAGNSWIALFGSSLFRLYTYQLQNISWLIWACEK